MNGIPGILIGGMTGWLTGKSIGEKGYGKFLSAGYARSLDVFFGAIGASFGSYLYFWAVNGEHTKFGKYATMALGSVGLVGTCRLVSLMYFPSLSDRRRSRAHSIEWHEGLAVKKLASWKPGARGISTTRRKRGP
jgi:hypothetical protein